VIIYSHYDIILAVHGGLLSTLRRYWFKANHWLYSGDYTRPARRPPLFMPSSGLKSEGCAYVPGRCPGLYYLALSGLVLCQLSQSYVAL
jgi:hypothetical protein